jgi:hypothetical protein
MHACMHMYIYIYEWIYACMYVCIYIYVCVNGGGGWRDNAWGGGAPWRVRIQTTPTEVSSSDEVRRAPLMSFTDPVHGSAPATVMANPKYLWKETRGG